VGLLITMGSGALVAAGSLRITSPGFQPNASLPVSATCEGEGRVPELQVGGVPPAAKSLVLIVVDPDVPKAIKSDGRFLHWAVWDLPPDAGAIVEGRGAGGLNENGGGGYIPACPPNGEHRYVFQLFALDTLLGKSRIAHEADLRRAMEGHVLDQAELVGRYTTRFARIVQFVFVAIVLLVALFVVRRIMARRRAAG
jgi:Raf kinase inhibitor-like YbhB/YbcL family protein